VRKVIHAALAAGVACVAFACSRSSTPAANTPDGAFDSLAHEYSVYLMSRFPVVATALGGSAFDAALAHIDGRLRDYTPVAVQQEDAHFSKLRQRFTALDPARLSAAHRIDRSVALAQIDFILHQHNVLHLSQRALDSYVDEPFRGVDWHMQGMTRTGDNTIGTEAEWHDLIDRTRAIPAYFTAARAQLAAGVAAGNTPDWRLLQEFGLQSAAADAEYFAKTLPQIAQTNIISGERTRMIADLQAAGTAASSAYLGLRDYIAQTFFDNPQASGIDGVKAAYRADRFAAGEAEYDWALHNNLRVETSAAQLYEASWPIVEATRGQMMALAREIAVSHKWRTPSDGAAATMIVLDMLSTNAPKTDAEMVDAYRKTGVRLVDYARRTGLFDVPANYQLEVTPTPPPLRASIDGAAYYSAPPFKTSGIGRFYVTPTGDDQARLAQEHNLYAMPDLAAHEGFPGHDWNYLVLRQVRNSLSPIRWLTPGAVEDSSSMWEDSMAAEGWALYSEGLLAEPQPGAPQGFYTPEEHLYQLQGQLYRDLRVRIDTGIHTGRMSFDDAVTLFSQVVDFQPGSCSDAHALRNPTKRASCDKAHSAVSRYSHWPTQAITYRLGKQQILDLRARAQAQLGARFSEKRFHLEFMKQGTIPPGYFADELLRTLAAP